MCLQPVVILLTILGAEKLVNKKPIISNRKKPYSPGLAVRGWEFPQYLIYLFKTLFLKPKVTIDLSLERGATEFSLPYFLLTIKASYKEIGNLNISVKGNFYDIHQQKLTTLPLIFEDIPQVIEASEIALLKCPTQIDFSNLHKSSDIKLTIEYGYMFLEQVQTVSVCSTWGFCLNDDMQPTLTLLTSTQTKM